MQNDRIDILRHRSGFPGANVKEDDYMKKNHVLLIAAAVMLSSCGTAAQYASSGDGYRFQDGIYGSTPSLTKKADAQEQKEATDALVAKTKASEIYLFGDRKDTVMIPKNMSATITYDGLGGGTSVTITDNPYDWRNNIDPWGWYGPSVSLNYGWGYARDWAHRGWYSPWYGGWHSSWGYGWYDPWYYPGGWYDPWYGGYWGWHDPWCSWHHHYCGWYGGWDPPFHGGTIIVKDSRWRGPRHSTGSDRVFTTRTSSRAGIATGTRGGRGTVSSSAPSAGKTHKDSKPDGPFKSLVISSKDNGQQGDGSFKRFPEPGSIIRLFNYSKTPRGDSRQTGISSFIGIILKTVIQLPPSCIFWPVIKFRCRFFRTFKLQPRHKLRQQQFAVIVAAKLQQKQQLTVKLQPLEQFSTKQVKL